MEEESHGLAHPGVHQSLGGTAVPGIPFKVASYFSRARAAFAAAACASAE